MPSRNTFASFAMAGAEKTMTAAIAIAAAARAGRKGFIGALKGGC
jgi:hypothetical protein